MNAQNSDIGQLITNRLQRELDKERERNQSPYLSALLASNARALVNFYMDNFSLIAYNLDFDSFLKLVQFEDFINQNKDFVVHYYKFSNYIRGLENQSEEDFNSSSIIHYYVADFLIRDVNFPFFIRFLVNNNIDICAHSPQELALFKINTGLEE